MCIFAEKVVISVSIWYNCAMWKHKMQYVLTGSNPECTTIDCVWIEMFLRTRNNNKLIVGLAPGNRVGSI